MTTQKITFSMNGFRRNLSNDISVLRDVVKEVLDGEPYDSDDLREAMNQIICSSNALNCVYMTDDPNFTDMGDLELDLIEEAAASGAEAA